MSIVFWDTNLFIYLVEGTGSLGRRTRALAGRMRDREDELFASTMTLGEVLVGPIRHGDPAKTKLYEELFERLVSLVPFDEAAARTYAQIRRDKSIEAPDAILLACAAQVNADFFITNDDDLARKRVHGIQFITTLDRVPI